jgi:hypothetical protein
MLRITESLLHWRRAPVSFLAMRGIVNIIIGVIFIIGGLTGKLALIGTSSGPALAVVGVILVIVGIMRFLRSRV